MKAKAGDVLVCQCEDCKMELLVQETCTADSSCGCGCEEGCEVTVVCCDKPMVVKEKKGGCCCGD